jgi:hypothetical protein
MTHVVLFGWNPGPTRNTEVLRYLRRRTDRKTVEAALVGDTFSVEEAERLAKQYGGKAVRR